MSGDDTAVYDDLMRFKPEGLTPNAWAVMAGVSRTVWADMRRHGNPSRRTLEKLLTAAGSSLAEFEALRIGTARARPGATKGLGESAAPAWGGPQQPGLPLFTTKPGRAWSDPSLGIATIELGTELERERAPRPASLAQDPSAYAIRVVGDAMYPRFRNGRTLAVSARQEPREGDDVVVRLKSRRRDPSSGAVEILLGELVRTADDHLELRQFSPPTTYQVRRQDIAAFEKVLGELI